MVFVCERNKTEGHIFGGGKRIARKGNAGNAIKWDQQQKKKDMECVHYESNKNGKRERERGME